MPFTPNLGITHLDPNSLSPVDVVNEQADSWDVAIAGMLTKSVAGSADVTLTVTPDGGEANNKIVVLNGALTGNISVILPKITREWHVYNNTSGAFSLTVKASTGSGVAIAQGQECDVRWDGTNFVQSSAVVTSPADISVDFGVGVMTNGQTIGRRCTRAHNFAANFASSKGDGTAASTGTAVVTVKKNGTGIGTITYTTATAAVFATSGGAAQSAVAGDLIEFVGPATADATLAGVRITLFATR